PSADEGVGTFTGNDTTIHVESVVFADTVRFPNGSYAASCQSSIDIWSKDWTTAKPTTCITVFWRYEVGANADTGYRDDICLDPQSIVVAGHEVGGGLVDCAKPGTVDNTLTYTYVGGTPNMTIPFNTFGGVTNKYKLHIPDESAFFQARAK